MFNLKKIFIILMLFWSDQSLMASVVRIVDENQWLVNPSKPPLDWYGEKLKTSTDILPPLNSNSIVKEIVIGEYEDNPKNLFHLRITLDYHDSIRDLLQIFYNSNLNRERLKVISQVDYRDRYVCIKDEDFPNFLKIFYEADVIPDSVLDIIIPKLQMSDFRLDTEEFIQQFNTKFKNHLLSEDVQKVMIHELDQIKYQKRRDQITWQIIKDLQNSEINYDNNLIKLLCERIHFQSPSYIDAQKILVKLLVSELSDQSSIEELCKAPIIKMLETNIPEKNAFIKAFLSNGHLSTDDLPLELQDISLSANSMFNLLNYIRKLQNKTSD